MMEVKVDGWQKGIRFSSAHATLNLGKCERLHGHSYAIHARVQGQLEDRRIVFDFVELTRALRQIADELDHFVLVPTRSREIKVEESKPSIKMIAHDRTYVFPRGDVFLLPKESSTAEDLATFILDEVKKRVDFPSTVTRVEIGCDEGFGQGAWAAWEPTSRGKKGGAR